MGGVRANYVDCFPEDNDNNKHVKTIANMRHVHHCIGTHEMVYNEGYTAVNTRKKPVEGPFSSPPAWDTMYMYHYVLRFVAGSNDRPVCWCGAKLLMLSSCQAWRIICVLQQLHKKLS